MASPGTTNSNYETVLELVTDSIMSQVRNYTEDQLQNLLNDENRLNAMVDSMPQVSSLLTDKELKLAQSKSFAEYNLSLEPKLREACTRLETSHANASKEKHEVELLKARLDSIAEDRSLDSISAILQAAVQEAEDQSEILAEKFQDGEFEIDEFIKNYNEKRVLAHMRKVKSEKLAEILRQQQYQPAASQHPVGHGSYPYPSDHPNNQYGAGSAAQSNYRHSYFR
uniref:VPS37 C-terminal domain-containing protein n=1 Tax=Ditylenchus dipsaci TaxID=166011 RepID=A0A915EK49_9BILA